MATSSTHLDLSGPALQVPDDVYDRSELTVVNLADKHIEEISTKVKQWTNLENLNLMNNRLQHLPTEIGSLSKLRVLGLKGNLLTSLPKEVFMLENLVEMYLTQNNLTSLPREIKYCTSLRKLQLSYNKLESLPAELATLPRLELCRAAVNPKLASVPSELGQSGSLCWLSLGSTVFSDSCPRPQPLHRTDEATWDEVTTGKSLGDGASGAVLEATYRHRKCAVKVFRSDTSPDGRCADEIEILRLVNHPNLTKVLAVIDGPSAGVVLELVDGSPLALKPNNESVLRCRWSQGPLSIPFDRVLLIAQQVASALAYLHTNAIAHGDVYAHNVLVNEATGTAVLCDYGASFVYPKGELCFERLEVRAFGLLVEDLMDRCMPSPGLSSLRRLISRCANGGERPNFKDVVVSLSQVQASAF